MFSDSQHDHDSACVSRYLFRYQFNYQNVGVRWRDGSVGKVLTAQAREREGQPQCPCKNAWRGHAYKTRCCEAERSSVASQPNSMVKWQVKMSVRVKKKKSKKKRKKKRKEPQRSTHTHAHACTQMHIYTYTHGMRDCYQKSYQSINSRIKS